MNANLIFKWLRDPRFALELSSVLTPAEEGRFLPVEIVANTKAPAGAPAVEGHIEIDLAGG